MITSLSAHRKSRFTIFALVPLAVGPTRLVSLLPPCSPSSLLRLPRRRASIAAAALFLSLPAASPFLPHQSPLLSLTDCASDLELKVTFLCSGGSAPQPQKRTPGSTQRRVLVLSLAVLGCGIWLSHQAAIALELLLRSPSRASRGPSATHPASYGLYFILSNRDASSVFSGRGTGSKASGVLHLVAELGQDGKVCQKFGVRKETLKQFFAKDLSSIQVDYN